LPDIEKALSLNPNYATAWADHGTLKGCLGDREQEFKDYEKALSLDPSLSRVHHNLGADYFKMGEYEKALEEYNISIAIDPHRVISWIGKNEALGALRRFEECVDNSTKGLGINPNEYTLFSDRALCESNLQDYTAAIKDYEIYTLNFENVAAEDWYNMGNAQQKNGDSHSAIDSYSKALTLSPSFYFAYANRGIAYNKIKEYEKALSDFNAALAGGEIPPAYSGRGETYYRLGNYDQAVSDLNLAISLNPDDIRASCFLAGIYFDIERYQNVLDVVKTFSIPGYTCREQNILEIQARSYYALGNYDQGIVYMDKAIAESPYPLGYYYRGIIFQAAQKNQEAVQDLELFLNSVPFSDDYEEEVSDAKARLAELK
jgi:tetratricopeptide (TPR) repeat protein